MERVPNPHPQVHRFDPRQELLDPYVEELTEGNTWGVPRRGRRSPRRCLVVHNAFDWGDDKPYRFRPNKAIIYELHVRGFTQHPSSGVSRPGTFAGLVEKIPYLKALGVNVVELVPVWAFEESDSDRVAPFTGERLLNYWGYHPIAFLSPNAPYSSRKGDGEEGKRADYAASLPPFLLQDTLLAHLGDGGRAVILAEEMR
jgi:isoamylase